jgi:hypothetical protein
MKIFRTTGWIEAKFSQNAGTVHPLGQMRASSNQIIVLTQLEIYKLHKQEAHFVNINFRTENVCNN